MGAQKIDLATVSLPSLVGDVEEGVKILTEALGVAAKFETFLPSGLDTVINDALRVLQGLESVVSKV